MMRVMAGGVQGRHRESDLEWSSVVLDILNKYDPTNENILRSERTVERLISGCLSF